MSSMIELGVFLLCLGGMIYLLSKAQETINKNNKYKRGARKSNS